jgi:NADPH:quinone reductase-like Zn-dependent oxidoreductase
MMRAVVYHRYGPPHVLELEEVEKPTPRDREVLVKVRATTVTIGDTIMRSLNLPISGWQRILARLYLGIRKPRRRVLGIELAGEIEAVGKWFSRQVH